MLERDDTLKSESDSLTMFRKDFLHETVGLSDALSLDDELPADEFFRRIASTQPGRSLPELFRKANLNQSLVEYTEKHGILELFGRFLREDSTFSYEEICSVAAVYHIIQYVDASFMSCPACGNIVNYSWGWCPYHATRGMKFEGEYQGADMNQKFISHLKNEFDKDTTIVDALIKDKIRKEIKKRIFVHWTEFKVKKVRGR